MRIQSQILLGFFFILLVSMALAIAASYYMERLGTGARQILKENYQSVKASEDLIITLAKTDQIMSKVCLGKNYNQVILFEILEGQKRVFEHNINSCFANISEPGESEILQQIETEWEDYKNSILEFEFQPERADYYFSVLQRQNEIIRDYLTTLIELNHAAINRKEAAQSELYFQARIWVFVFLIMALVITGVTIVFVPRRVATPILQLADKINQVAKGRYDQRVPVPKQGEMRRVANAFNSMSARLLEFEQLNVSEIKAQKRRIETIIKSLRDGLIILDEQRRIILTNGSASILLNISEAELIGQTMEDLATDHPVIRNLLRSLNTSEGKAVPDRRGKDKFIKVEYENGQVEFYSKEIINVYGKTQGKPDPNKSLGYIVMLKDVTDFKTSDDAKTNFLAVVSHELKTPLSSMNMSLMLLKDKRLGQLNEEQAKIATNMRADVQRLIKMVSELTDLSKVEAGNVNLELEKVLPGDIVEASLRTFDTEFHQKDIRLLKSFEFNQALQLFVDPEKLAWVLNNFISNALRYTPKGGEIDLQVYQNERHLEFAVRDYGEGIDQEQQHKVFQRFVQLRKKNGKKNKEGLGLGLAISKEVIEEHGGEIGVESEVGKGSRFFFRIPLETEPVH